MSLTSSTTAFAFRNDDDDDDNEDNDDAFEAKGFGPWRPLDQGRGGLDDRARAELNKFIEAYSQRTIKSKQLANEQRPHLSDARSISGFRQDWKEMVYQIAGAGSKGTKIWDVDGNEYIDFVNSLASLPKAILFEM